MIRNQHHEDYIMRQVQALAAAVSRLLALKTGMEHVEADAGAEATAQARSAASAEAQRALRDLTGAEPALIVAVSPATLLEWIRRDASPETGQLLVDAAVPLLREYARLLADDGRARDAAAFAAHAAWLAAPTAELAAPTAELAAPTAELAAPTERTEGGP